MCSVAGDWRELTGPIQATCPAERKLASRRMQSVPDLSMLAEPASPTHSHLYAPLVHQHDHCKPFSVRRYRGYSRTPPSDEDDDEMDDPFGLAEEHDGTLTVPRKDGVRRKSVGFADVVRPTVFRYPSAALIEAYYGEAGEEQSQPDEAEDDKEDWWWAGWEEHKGSDDESFMDCE